MKYRKLGRTGLHVSEVGFGAAGIANGSWTGADKRSSVRALIAAYDAGINFFDTAWVHGRGESERLLARVFGKSMNIVIASKVPPRNGIWPAAPGVPLREVFPIAHVLGYLRKTLSNLRRDAVDLYQFHVWNDEWVRDPEWPELLDQVRRTGWVQLIGISTNDHQPDNALAALGTGMIDTVQVVYDFFDRSPEERLFPYCIERGIGVIARATFDGASLNAGLHNDRLPTEHDYTKRSAEDRRKSDAREQVQRISIEMGIAPTDLARMALRFSLSHRAVGTVVSELRTAAHVRDSIEAAEDDRVNSEFVERLSCKFGETNSEPVTVKEDRLENAAAGSPDPNSVH